ncbi:MAG: argininosuccinate lyase [Promethearchaeota archaeon]
MSNILDKYRKKPLKKEALSFLSSLQEDLWILEEDVLGTIAHVIMLKRQNILMENDAKKILKELVGIYEEIKEGTFTIEEEFEDIHPYIEHLIINKIGIEVGGKIHSGRSRNDQVALDIRLKVRKELIIFHESLIELLNSLLEQSKKSIKTFCPLYTHLQQAQLGTFSHILLNYAFQILRLIERIEFCYESINYNPLGACAIGGTSFPINRKFTTEILGFNGMIINSIDAISSRDDFIMVLMFLAIAADIYSRICEDLIIFSTNEFNFIKIDDEYASVSSVLPQKKNPDTLELIRGKMSRIYASLNHILFMSKGIFSGYMRDFQETKVPLQISFENIIKSTNILSGIIQTLKINEESMINSAKNSMIRALDLAEYIAKNTSLSFRETHGLIGNLVKNYRSFDKILNKELIEKHSLKLFNKEIKLKQHELDLFKDLQYVLDLRKSEGSPNNEQIKKSIELISNKMKRFIRFSEIKTNQLKQIESNIINMAKKIYGSG